MPSKRQWVVVDDTDINQIQYSDDWSVNNATISTEVGHSGPPFQQSLHGTTVNGSKFSFTFQGSAVWVLATIPVTDAPAVYWDCFIDGHQIPASHNTSWPGSGYQMCRDNSLTVGTHTLIVQATTHGQTLWFDALRFLPSPTVSLNNATLYIYKDYEGIQYGSGWHSYNVDNQVFQGTQTFGDTLHFNWTGKRLTWRGGIIWSSGSKPGLYSYSIDGDSSYSPLILDSFYITNNTLLNESSSTSSTLPDPTDSDGPPTSSSRKAPVGAIVGGVLAGLALISLVLALLFWRSWRKSKMMNVNSTPASGSHNDLIPTPYSTQATDNDDNSIPPHVINPGFLAGPQPLRKHAPVVQYSQNWTNSASSSTGPPGSPMIKGPSLLTSHRPEPPNRSQPLEQVVHHHDSGVRMVEVPPSYTIH